MSENNQVSDIISDIADSLTAEPHDVAKCQACRTIRNNDIYVLSPHARLCNAKGLVRLYFKDEVTVIQIHRAIAIVLALCNGKRTVAEIAQITRPLVPISSDQKAIEISNHKVKYFLNSILQYYIGRQTRLLHSKTDYNSTYSSLGFPNVEYNVRDFLPKDASDMAPFRVIHEASPLELRWHFTSKCDVNCQYCSLNRRKGIKYLPKERVLSLIKEAAAIGVHSIQPFGGDMLLYPYLRNILELMHECKFVPVILSTKTFLSQEKAAMIRDTRMTYILQYSIDSTDDKIADYIVRRKGFCKSALESIDNAVAAGVPVATRTVITPYNLLSIPQLYHDMKKRGVKLIQLAMYVRSGYRHSDSFFISKDDYAWLETQVQHLKEEFPKDDISIQNSKPRTEPRSGKDKIEADDRFKYRAQCPVGLYAMMICPDGKVIPCEQMHETEEYFCGDLSSQSIQEVWNSSRLMEMTHGVPREKFKGTVCYDCEEREECRNVKGVCVRNLAIYHKNIYLPDMNCPKAGLPFIRTT